MHTPEHSGMQLLGQHDLGGHGNCGEGTALLCRGGRRFLYLAHEDGPENFSVLDVTDPTEPRERAGPRCRLPQAALVRRRQPREVTADHPRRGGGVYILQFEGQS